MSKLMQTLSRRGKTRDYFRFLALVPADKVEELKWKKGTELRFDVVGNKLVVSEE